MQTFLPVFESISRVFLLLTLGWYLILNLQWFSYRLDRLVFHHTKPWWNVANIVLPIALFYVAGAYFWVFFYLVYLPTLFLWYRKIDKKLVVTARVKRFFALLAFASALIETLRFFEIAQSGGVLSTLILTLICSQILENFLRSRFKKQASRKLLDRKDLIVIVLTASYGKTSLKHFLLDILKPRFRTYATPGNVNTDLGIAADINNSLPSDAQIYIIEAGAREIGDIMTIALMTQPHYAIIGKVGKQHIEYFKTEENIKRAKREALISPRMRRAIVHESAKVEANDAIVTLNDAQIQNLEATLDGTRWNLALHDRVIRLETPVLGGFNAVNISLAFLAALELGIGEEEIAKAVSKLNNFEHRLQPIKNKYKFILDDSYNGNLDGMLGAISLCSSWNGRKVIVTPGIVESDDESNIALAAKINEVFDLAFITGALNADLLCSHIDRDKRKRIYDKRGLETILAKETRSGDLILFANDAPSYV
ncbi:MAG: UDP-N-acetylmuramoyl-tripeptide--D-alanyl-D-alanine ligase [Helicobacteraceae bacterium]|nr:UDP-N-acetylmuramoyl-tripeptide--D-alanyl-D-alanine ligase [Helicobacteraceae bacterium]